MLPPDPETDDVAALRSEAAELRDRAQRLEAERDEYAQLNAQLFVLQQLFSTMNSTLEIDDILATVLRGVQEALRFGRVTLLEVRDGVVVRRLESADGDLAVSPPAAGTLRDTASLRALAAGTLDLRWGVAADGESALPDADGMYCMLPLISRNTVLGILHVDRPPAPEITELQLRMLLDFAAQAAIALENARLYSETKRLLEETQRLASTDPLTGLANRRALTELAEHEIHNAERYNAPLALVVLDLDDLKAINDAGGHAAGDDALRRFAEVLRRLVRRGDLAARYAGDEFVLVMAQTDAVAVEGFLARVFGALAREGLTCSGGVAVFPDAGRSFAGLFAAADAALYEAKQAGKNRFRIASRP